MNTTDAADFLYWLGIELRAEGGPDGIERERKLDAARDCLERLQQDYDEMENSRDHYEGEAHDAKRALEDANDEISDLEDKLEEMTQIRDTALATIAELEAGD